MRLMVMITAVLTAGCVGGTDSTATGGGTGQGPENPNPPVTTPPAWANEPGAADFEALMDMTICDGDATVVGSLTETTLADADGARCVIGSISVVDTPAVAVQLADVEIVIGDVAVLFADEAQSVRMPRLRGVAGSFQLELNRNLETLSLENLELIDGDLIIASQTELDSLEGLSGLRMVTGDLVIQDNTELTSLAGLDRLQSVGGNLIIFGNKALTQVSGLNALTWVGGTVTVKHNPVLGTISGFGSLSMIGGSLRILDQVQLTTLQGFQRLTSIGGDLEWTRTALRTVGGLSALDNVGNDVRFTENLDLTAMDGLGALRVIATSLHIEDNESLQTLSGLDNLQELRQVVLIGNRTLSNVDALGSIVEINASLVLERCDAVQSLSALSGLTRAGALRIVDNRSLSSLGLDSLQSLGAETAEQSGSLFIQANPELPTCDIRDFVETLRDNDWQGPETIIENGPGCETVP